MPRYECECQAKDCGDIYEVQVPLDELDEFDTQKDKDHRCPGCKGKLKRIISPVDFRITV